MAKDRHGAGGGSEHPTRCHRYHVQVALCAYGKEDIQLADLRYPCGTVMHVKENITSTTINRPLTHATLADSAIRLRPPPGLVRSLWKIASASAWPFILEPIIGNIGWALGFVLVPGMFDLPGLSHVLPAVLLLSGRSGRRRTMSPLRPLFRYQPTRTSAAAWRGVNAQFFRDFSLPPDKWGVGLGPAHARKAKSNTLPDLTRPGRVRCITSVLSLN